MTLGCRHDTVAIAWPDDKPPSKPGVYMVGLCCIHCGERLPPEPVNHPSRRDLTSQHPPELLQALADFVDIGVGGRSFNPENTRRAERIISLWNAAQGPKQ